MAIAGKVSSAASSVQTVAYASASKKTSSTSIKKYTVRSGDTLGGIAHKFKSSVSILQKLNKITNVNLIFPGQQVKVPVKSSDSASKPSAGSGSSSGSGNTIDKLIKTAKSQDWVSEYTSAGRKRIAEYNKSAGVGASQPWCASFLTWAAKKVGLKPPSSAPAKAESWASWGKSSSLKKGAIITMYGKDHVAIYLGKNSKGQHVTVGGNERNEVKIQAWSKLPNLNSIRWPK